MRRAILTAIFCVALAGAAGAETTGYQCRINGTTERDWIQPLIFIGLDSATDRVVVSDPAILGVNGGVPVEGQLVKDNAARTTFAWTLTARSRHDRRVVMGYRATYLKASGRFNVTARSAAHDRVFTRLGRCTVRKLSG